MDEIVKDINTYVRKRPASIRFMEEMGYKKTNKKLKLSLRVRQSEKYDTKIIYELVDELSGVEAPFSFMFDPEKREGTVLPRSYTEYSKIAQPVAV